MPTIAELAIQLNIKPTSLQRKIQRFNRNAPGINENVPLDILELLGVDPKKSNGMNGRETEKRPPAAEKRPPAAKKQVDYIKILQVLPLPMLGLAASYGVFFFARQFVPTFVAIAEACAFELTYIGMATIKGLTDRQQKYARKVSIGAVFVSVLYNTLAGAIHQDPEIFENLHKFWFWILAVIHGAPLALLAYFVADLIFHQKKY